MSGPEQLDVDARFLLANERTLLAWVRTALTFIAVGLGLLAIVDRPGRRLPALLLLGVGAMTATAGLLRYLRADRAIRAGELPPTGRAPVVVAGAVVGVAVLVLALAGQD